MNQEPWIVVPAYNEQQRLDGTLAALTRRYANVVLVDDGSTDDTWQVAAQYPVHRLRHAINLGQGAAIGTGISYALLQGAEIIVTFDSDGQHDVADVESLVVPIRSGRVDVTLGSRFLGSASGIPKSRRIILKLGVLFTRLFSRIQVTDTHNGLRAFSRPAAKRIRIFENGMAHASEILDEIYRLNLRYEEVPVAVRYSGESLKKGQSSWNAIRIAGRLVLGRLVR